MSASRPKPMRLAGAALLTGGALLATTACHAGRGANEGARAATPIQHLVVIYQENHSFDNYFGTYPNAANPPGEPTFHAVVGTPAVNGLSNALRTSNPNLANPKRLDRSQQITCDNNHGYVPMQLANERRRSTRQVRSIRRAHRRRL